MVSQLFLWYDTLNELASLVFQCAISLSDEAMGISNTVIRHKYRFSCQIPSWCERLKLENKFRKEFLMLER